MTRYSAMFRRCKERSEGAFGAFLMLGDPDPVRCAKLLDAMVAGGADMVELGIPFSDPVADGPVIQAAAARALRSTVRTGDCLRLIADFRARHPEVPVGVLTYANIVGARGIDRFAAELAEAGADSLLVADVPTIEAEPYAAAARSAGIDLVMIAAPNTPEAALRRIAGLSSGYTYCVARNGVTGADRGPELRHSDLLADLEKLGAPPPVFGFGIGTPEHVREAMRAGAAGVICGSAIVRLVESGQPVEDIRAFIALMKSSTKLASVTQKR